MLQEWTPPEHPRQIPAPPKTRASDADVRKIADLLTQARNPVILTETAGRDPAAFAALVELAEHFGIPVGGRAVFANFPKDHPLHLGTGIQPFLKDADLILLVACRAPWYPPSRKPTSGTVVAIDENPLKGTMVYQSLQADHYLEGEVVASLRLLLEAATASGIGAGNRPVAALIGDGSVLYNPGVQALGASKGNGLPVLIVVCNNQQYRAMQTGHLHHYPDGVAQEAEIWHGVTIDGPDYAELGKPFGLHGQKVERPAELPNAIREAMRAVEDGKTAILNIVLSR